MSSLHAGSSALPLRDGHHPLPLGCFGEEAVTPPVIEEEPSDARVFVTDRYGASVAMDPVEMTFQFSDVGETGKEPSIGITSSGCIFFIAMEKVMRSCDGGATWEETQDPVMCSPTTSDPYGWVDPITDRVFGVQMIGLETSWICWSDDDGETWLGNLTIRAPLRSTTTSNWPAARGPAVATVWWVKSRAVSTKRRCITATTNWPAFCFTSYDGGATFETAVKSSDWPPTEGYTGLFPLHRTARSTLRLVSPHQRSSFPKTTAFPGLSAPWARM